MAELEQINKGNVAPPLEEIVVTDSMHIGAKTDGNKLLTSDQISQKISTEYYVDSMANMRAATSTNPVINLEGHTTENDGGQGTFYWDATSTENDDGGTIIKLDTVTTGRYKRFYTDTLEPKWFGAKGDGVTDDADALNDLYAAAIKDGTNVYFTRGIYNIESPVTIQGVSSKGFVTIGEYNSLNGHNTTIQFVGDVSTYKTMFVTRGSMLHFKNMKFIHNDEAKTEDTYIFDFTRDDVDTKQDVDAYFERCFFERSQTVVKLVGRGIDLFNCRFNAIRVILELDWPEGFVDPGESSPHTRLTTGMRTFKVRNCQMHGCVNGIIIKNTGYNKTNAFAFEISNNFIDTSMGILEGSLKAANVFGNTFTYMGDSKELFSLDDDTISNVIIDSNLFSGLITTQYDYPAKEIMRAIYASKIENVIFSNNTVAGFESTIFNLTDADINQFSIVGNIFSNILMENDDTDVKRVLLRALNPTSITFTNNTASQFTRAFNPNYLIDIPTEYLSGLLVENNVVDSDTPPLVEPTPKDSNLNGGKLTAGSLQVDGAIFEKVTAINSATYTLLETDNILHVAHTQTAAVAITLPTAQTVEGRMLTVKDAGGNSSVNNITIDTEGTETIDAKSAEVISADFGRVSLYCDGANWFVI